MTKRINPFNKKEQSGLYHAWEIGYALGRVDGCKDGLDNYQKSVAFLEEAIGLTKPRGEQENGNHA